MNKIIVAAFVLGSVSTGVLLAQAQPAGTTPRGPVGGPLGAPTAADTSPMERGPSMGRGNGAWGDRMHELHARRMEMMRNFALIDRAEDRKLTPADVQKIAEAFLLWNGNHTWKVLNVKPDGDVIGFDLATAEGSVIAHFTMDPKTAHLARAG